MMDSFENKEDKEQVERKELFSKRVRCGRRTYFFDVKSSKNNEPYLAITESKKILNGFGEEATATFEKHKIFLYKEDFEKFQSGITDAIAYIEGAQGKADPRPEPEDSDIKIDVEF